MGKLLVLTDQHPQLVVIHANILVEHTAWDSTSVVYIFIKEREYHVGVVHRRLPIGFFRKAIVVVIGLHDFDELIHRVVKLMDGGIVTEHLAHFLLREAHHLIEGIVE